jgi:hypothetical protein
MELKEKELYLKTEEKYISFFKEGFKSRMLDFFNNSKIEEIEKEEIKAEFLEKKFKEWKKNFLGLRIKNFLYNDFSSAFYTFCNETYNSGLSILDLDKFSRPEFENSTDRLDFFKKHGENKSSYEFLIELFFFVKQDYDLSNSSERFKQFLYLMIYINSLTVDNISIKKGSFIYNSFFKEGSLEFLKYKGCYNDYLPVVKKL